MTNPHDAFVKATLGNPSQAALYLEHFLPAPIVAALDLARLELEPGTYVEETLRERHSDLLFRAPLRAPVGEGSPDHAFLYVLFEHQSTVDPRMPYRLLRYLVAIWDRWLHEHGDASPCRLPAIVPHVLYHGSAGWTVAPGLLPLLAVGPELAEELAPLTPHFDFVLTDLSRYSEDELRLGALGGAMQALPLLVLQSVFAADLNRRLHRWAALFRQLLDQGTSGLHAVKLIIEYLLQAAPHVGAEDLRSFCTSEMGSQAEEIAMTAAEQLRNEGRDEGRAEGRADLLLHQVFLKFGAPDDVVRRRVEEAGSEQIRVWAERILTAGSLDELLEARAEAKE